jgi:hypothetical protein
VTKGSLKINKGSVIIHFGKPISVMGYEKRDIGQLMERVREEMLDMME